MTARQRTWRTVAVAAGAPLVGALVLDQLPALAFVWRALALLGVALATAWIRGPWAGAVGLAVVATLVDFFWLAPRYSLRIAGVEGQLVLGILVALSAVILLVHYSLPDDRGPR